MLLMLQLLLHIDGSAQTTITLPQWGNAYTPLGSNSMHLVDRIDIQYNKTYQHLHSTVKPYLREDIASLAVAYHKFDSLNQREQFNVNYLSADNSEFVTLDEKSKYYRSNLGFFFS